MKELGRYEECLKSKYTEKSLPSLHG